MLHKIVLEVIYDTNNIYKQGVIDNIKLIMYVESVKEVKKKQR